MSVTIYLTDHRGKQIAFFYRIDSERYLTCPSILWACRDHREYSGVCHSKEEALEAFKSVIKDIARKDRSVPARKKCKECDSDLHLRENESNLCDTCNPITT
jgi:peptide subunit release factor RF-3